MDRVKREYPEGPLLGVAGVVVDERSRVLLVRRLNDPGKGRWGLPGGLVELGESLAEALQRELREECGVEVEPRDVLGVVEVRQAGDQGRLRFHYVLVDLLAACRAGDLRAGSDAGDARWVEQEELERLPLSHPQTLSIIRKGLAVAGATQPAACQQPARAPEGETG
jgi:8-oxo-dGTP diphosphatase